MKSTYIFDQRIDVISLKKVFFIIKKSVSQKRKNLFFAINVNILLLLNKDQKFREKHSKIAKIIFPDGVPLIWLSKILNSKNKIFERVAGTDLTEMILKDKSFKVFLLGGSKDVLQKAKKKYKSVCGFYSPPFNENWVLQEEDKIINMINESEATVLLVALGPLKQERWLIKNIGKLNCYVGVGVGSAIDILTESKLRAPKLLKNNGFEWIWRILLEPRRLFRRYFYDFFNLLRLIIKNYF